MEVSIGGASEQSHRAQIQIDGTITISGIGTVEVAGMTTAELQNRRETLLQSKVVRQRLSDEREQAIVVVPGDVTASVVEEYRPNYVTGDVLKRESWHTGHR